MKSIARYPRWGLFFVSYTWILCVVFPDQLSQKLHKKHHFSGRSTSNGTKLLENLTVESFHINFKLALDTLIIISLVLYPQTGQFTL